MRYYSQCLFYALDRWSEEGGELVLVKSTHWAMPHCQHRSREGKLTHFVPPHDLSANWHCLFGFYGDVVVGDEAPRLPMHKGGMFLGTLTLLLFGAMWAAIRTVQKLGPIR